MSENELSLTQVHVVSSFMTERSEPYVRIFEGGASLMTADVPVVTADVPVVCQ